MNLLQDIQNYKPENQQEENDKTLMLQYMAQHSRYLYRDDQIAHFSASSWTLNKKRTKALMVYHNIYDSWSWTGGHADGEENLRSVALRELREETGVRNAFLLSENIFSLEILTVDGHIKNGVYIPSHLHFNITYLTQADEGESLTINEAENQAVKWCTLEEVISLPREPWMVEHVYKKLIQKAKRLQ